MSIETDDTRLLRQRESYLDDDMRRLAAEPPVGSPTILAVTASRGAYPTTASSYFVCQPQTLLGAEVEGGPGSVTASPVPTFLAFNLGTAVPTLGAQVLATFVGNRWVFRFDG